MFNIEVRYGFLIYSQGVLWDIYTKHIFLVIGELLKEEKRMGSAKPTTLIIN